MLDDARPHDLTDSLLSLADRCGIVPDFWGFDGSHRWVPAATVVSVLAALGVDASSPERLELAHRHAEDDVWRRAVPPVVVLREGSGTQVPVHVRDGAQVAVWLEPEDGGASVELNQYALYA